MIQDQENNEYVSLVRIPRKWFHAFVVIFLTLIITNTMLELLTSWEWKLLGDTIINTYVSIDDIDRRLVFIVAHIWEVIMLGYAKMFRDKVYAEGKAEGRAEVYRQLKAWEQRKKETEARGDEFTEPLPIPDTEKQEQKQ